MSGGGILCIPSRSFSRSWVLVELFVGISVKYRSGVLSRLPFCGCELDWTELIWGINTDVS